MKNAHFLHIGKTGGTAIKEALKSVGKASRYKLFFHQHHVTLKDIPEGEAVFFFVRDPVSRFVSGFYSRQRKGQPRYYSEWSSAERRAFELFPTPNELAGALADKDSVLHEEAVLAINNIQHMGSYKFWYGSLDYFKSRSADIIFIGHQESLADDFEKLLNIIGVELDIVLPEGDIESHRNPSYVDRTISEPGLTNLKLWYRDDYEFISHCKKWLQ